MGPTAQETESWWLLVFPSLLLTGDAARNLDQDKLQRGLYLNMPSCPAAKLDVTGFDRYVCMRSGGSFVPVLTCSPHRTTEWGPIWKITANSCYETLESYGDGQEQWTNKISNGRNRWEKCGWTRDPKESRRDSKMKESGNEQQQL